MKDLWRPGSPFGAWIAGMTILFVVVEFVNPAIWYSADVLGTARIVAATGGAAAAGIVGALFGAVIGLIAAFMAARKPVPADRKQASRALAAARARNGYIVFGCIVASAAFAAFNLTFTSEKASYVACTTIQADLNEATANLSGAPKTTVVKANDGLGRTKICSGSWGWPLVRGALYMLRGAAYLETDLLTTRADADFARAEPLIKGCRAQAAGTDKAQMCANDLVAIAAYRTQHFCDDAIGLANRADNELYSAPVASRIDAQRGVTAAGKCTNSINWAYRAIALAQRGQAEVALGLRATTTLAESSRLLGRCVRDLSGKIQTECKSAQKVVAQARAGRVGPG